MSNSNFTAELRRALLLLTVCFVGAMVASCGSNKKSDEQAQADAAAALSQPAPPDFTDKDSTLYGRADGFGSGGFTLITNDGRELELTLTGEDEGGDAPSYAHVYGDREDTARYAVMTRDGEAVDVLINLSQLERQVGTGYVIHNGLLFVPNDEGQWEQVTIVQLDDKVLRTQTAKGDIRSFRK